MLHVKQDGRRAALGQPREKRHVETTRLGTGRLDDGSKLLFVAAKDDGLRTKYDGAECIGLSALSSFVDDDCVEAKVGDDGARCLP